MIGWYHQLSGYELAQTLEDSGGQRDLACCGPWGRRESGTTSRLNDKANSDKLSFCVAAFFCKANGICNCFLTQLSNFDTIKLKINLLYKK